VLPPAASKIAGKSMIPYVLDMEQLDAVAVALDHGERIPDAAAVRRPVQVELEDDVLRVGVRHQDVVHRLVAEDRLELDVMVVDHQRLAGLPRLLTDLVQVLRVRDPLRLGGVDRREDRRGAGPEVLDP
jgi:hypothetical protein